MNPLVSVMMPCYNSTKTLPMALASLIAQTYSNWECILVDDGSTDQPHQILEIVNDQRIKYFRFEENRGRGAARQFALNKASGDYLCMLDSDDWIFPHKLERQIQIMEEKAEISLLSTCMAIIDEGHALVGIRPPNSDNGQIIYYSPLTKPKLPFIAFAPSMIRMKIAKETNFDTVYPIIEDTDFLLRIMMKYPFAVLSEATYVYDELETVTLLKIRNALHYCRYMFSAYHREFPYTVEKLKYSLYLKELIYIGAYTSGLDKLLIARRSQKPSDLQISNFLSAKSIVQQSFDELFASSNIMH